MFFCAGLSLILGCHDEEKEQQAFAVITDLVQAEKGDEALAQLSVFLERYPKNALAWVIKGNLHEKNDANAQAKLAYERALKLNPKQVQALNGLGILANKRADYPEAMQYFERAVAVDPTYAGAWSSMVNVALKRHHDEKALKIAKKAVALDPNNPVYAANLAIAYHYNKMLPERARAHQRAKALGYNNLTALEQIFLGILSVR